jgi:hypothetical protein
MVAPGVVDDLAVIGRHLLRHGFLAVTERPLATQRGAPGALAEESREA